MIMQDASANPLPAGVDRQVPPSHRVHRFGSPYCCRVQARASAYAAFQRLIQHSTDSVGLSASAAMHVGVIPSYDCCPPHSLQVVLRRCAGRPADRQLLWLHRRRPSGDHPQVDFARRQCKNALLHGRQRRRCAAAWAAWGEGSWDWCLPWQAAAAAATGPGQSACPQSRPCLSLPCCR